jgi:hypothetical protein
LDGGQQKEEGHVSDTEHPKQPTTKDSGLENAKSKSEPIERTELQDEQLSDVSGGMAVHKSGDPCDGGNIRVR